MSTPATRQFLNHASAALRCNQRELGESLGVSTRTVSRWYGGRSSPSGDELARLAVRVHAVDPALAERLVPLIGRTLASLGIASPPPPKAAPSTLQAALTLADRLDCVVCAVAEAENVSPRAVRRVVLLALRRAHELGIDVALVAKMAATPTAPEERASAAGSAVAAGAD